MADSVAPDLRHHDQNAATNANTYSAAYSTVTPITTVTTSGPARFRRRRVRAFGPTATSPGLQRVAGRTTSTGYVPRWAAGSVPSGGILRQPPQFRRPCDEVYDTATTGVFSLSYVTAQSSSSAECDLGLFSSMG